MLYWGSILAILAGLFPHSLNGESISGTVRDNNNAPLRAAEVRGVSSNGLVTVVLTNAQGKFVFPDLKAAEYAVTAYKKFYVRSRETNVQLRKPVPNVNFSIQPTNDPPAIQLSTADVWPLLPGTSDQKDLFLNRCGRCHSLGIALQKPREAEKAGRK
jgi:hypothetical protein